MSRGVGVLEVMDHVRPYVKSEAGFLEVRSFDEARAAIADVIDLGSRMSWQSHADDFSAFHAALARARGAA